MVTTNAPIITLRDVRFTYDGGATWALDGVSLDIQAMWCSTSPARTPTSIEPPVAA